MGHHGLVLGSWQVSLGKFDRLLEQDTYVPDALSNA